MWNYLFEFNDEYSYFCGDRIFVQCDSFEEAKKILEDIFPNEKYSYLGVFNDDDAEEMGYDTF